MLVSSVISLQECAFKDEDKKPMIDGEEFNEELEVQDKKANDGKRETPVSDKKELEM